MDGGVRGTHCKGANAIKLIHILCNVNAKMFAIAPSEIINEGGIEENGRNSKEGDPLQGGRREERQRRRRVGTREVERKGIQGNHLARENRGEGKRKTMGERMTMG